MSKGIALVVSGPSGCGKDTLLREFFAKHPEVSFSISTVTRPPRGNAAEDSKYTFTTAERFEQLLRDNQLLEHNVYVGNYYGTPRQPVEQAIADGRDIIIEVDVNGAANIRRNMDGIVSLFIMPPSMDTLRQRLIGRGTESQEVCEQRLAAAVAEIERSNEFDYIVINDRLDAAVDEIYAILVAEKAKYNNNKQFINEVLYNA